MSTYLTMYPELVWALEELIEDYGLEVVAGALDELIEEENEEGA